MKTEEKIISIYKDLGLTPEECVQNLGFLLYTAASSLPYFDEQIILEHDKYKIEITEKSAV